MLRADGSYSFRWLPEHSESAASEGTSEGASEAAPDSTSKGGWCLRGSMVWLSGGEWVGYASDVWLSGRSPAGFLLFGGVERCRDPDSHMVLTWEPLGPAE